jgi:protein phosphatase 1 regulatory subunit 7
LDSKVMLMIRQNRIQNPTELDCQLIEQQIKSGWDVIVQFSDKLYTDKLLNEINNLCQHYGSQFGVRFYGHTFDCKNLERIPDVKCLSLDCILEVKNLQVVTKLMNLERLGLGIFEMKETEILGAENLQKIKYLMLTNTKTKAFNLEHLRNYHNLTTLMVCGHTKNINSIGELSQLNQLNLNSISKVPLHFINKLKELKTLKIILGGRSNMEEIEKNDIENLEIVWVRGFSSFKNVSNFGKLKTLQIEDNIQLKELHFAEALKDLEYFRLLNCKTFTSITGLEKLKNLSHLRIYRTAIDFENFIRLPKPDSLKILAFYTTRAKTDTIIRERLKSMGYAEGLNSD